LLCNSSVIPNLFLRFNAIFWGESLTVIFNSLIVSPRLFSPKSFNMDCNVRAFLIAKIVFLSNFPFCFGFNLKSLGAGFSFGILPKKKIAKGLLVFREIDSSCLRVGLSNPLIHFS